MAGRNWSLLRTDEAFFSCEWRKCIRWKGWMTSVKAKTRNRASEYPSDCCCGYNTYKYLILCLCAWCKTYSGANYVSVWGLPRTHFQKLSSCGDAAAAGIYIVFSCRAGAEFRSFYLLASRTSLVVPRDGAPGCFLAWQCSPRESQIKRRASCMFKTRPFYYLSMADWRVVLLLAIGRCVVKQYKLSTEEMS